MLEYKVGSGSYTRGVIRVRVIITQPTSPHPLSHASKPSQSFASGTSNTYENQRIAHKTPIHNLRMSQANTPTRRVAMDPPFKFPHSPATPLFPLSPERLNGSRPPYGSAMAQSPSLPDFVKPSDFELNPTSPKKTVHSRNNSEAMVQGMVARFDSLSLKDHQQLHRRDEVAIKRAEMAREMAELELKKAKEERDECELDAKRWREDCRKLRKEAEEGRERERKMAKRLEAQTVSLRERGLEDLG